MVMGFNDKNISQWFMVLIAVGSMISSWALVHTLYVFHYAHLYYKTKGGKGLDYPGDENLIIWILLIFLCYGMYIPGF
jgi:uncharacterized membrane protein